MGQPIITAMRRRLRRGAIRGGLECAHLASRAGISRPGRGVIFTLHHVRPATDAAFAPNAHLAITPEFLAQTIRHVVERGYQPVHLHDLPRLIAETDSVRPQPRYCAFTLDDGYRDNADHAYPVFQALNVPFMVFVTGGFIDRTRSIWWKTVEELIAANDAIAFDFGNGTDHVDLTTDLAKYAAFCRFDAYMRAGDEDRKVDALDRVARRHGIEPLDIVERDVMNARDLKSLIRDPLCALGAHTLTHIAMAGVDAERLRHEIVASADRVREITGHAPRSFAYPYGDSRAAGAREFAAVRGAGFDIAVTTRPALLTPTSCDRPTAFGRVSLNGHFQKTRYVDALLSGLLFRQPRPEPAQLSVPVRAYG